MRKTLSWVTQAIYACAGFAFTALISASGFFLLVFYTDVARVPAGIAGAALLVGKLWDTVNDPLAGWWSDRANSRLGRRRAFMVYSLVPLMLSTLALWSFPSGMSTLQSFLWIAITYLLYDTFFTLAYVPYCALSPSLVEDYDARMSLSTFLAIGGVGGYLFGSVATRAIVSHSVTPFQGYFHVGITLAALTGLGVGLMAWKMREPSSAAQGRVHRPLRETLRDVSQNKPFLILTATLALLRLSLTLAQTSLAYFVTYQLRAEKKLAVVMFILLGSVGASIWIWKWLSVRFNKTTAFLIGMFASVLAMFASFMLGPQSGYRALAVIACLGVAISSNWVCPFAMMPDVIEHGELKSGGRHEGVYYGIWAFVDKLMRAMAVFLVGQGLAMAGYVPGVEQSSASLLGIRFLFGGLPAIIILLAIPILWMYPITRESHARTSLALEANRRKDGSLQ